MSVGGIRVAIAAQWRGLAFLWNGSITWSRLSASYKTSGAVDKHLYDLKGLHNTFYGCLSLLSLRKAGPQEIGAAYDASKRLVCKAISDLAYQYTLEQ